MPLLSIYNNLIHGYMMSRQTRFDSHKRSELSEIHNRIRKISSEQPLYKIDFDADAQEYALSVKEHAMELAAAIKDMGSDESEGAFSRFIIKSDHPGMVGVEVLEGSEPGKIEDFDVQVERLSSPQINSGYYVDSRENSLVSGQYNFTVEIEGSFYSFQFNVTGSNDNKELQTKLADFINKTKVGLRAEVVSDRENGKSALNLEAKKFGVPFEFKDTKTPEGTNSGVVELFGLNNVRSEAGKTVIYIKGERIENEDRKIVTSDGLLLDIKKETADQPVRIYKVVDDESVFKKISEFVRKYNDMSEYVRAGANTRRASKKLWYELNGLLTEYADKLSASGIEMKPENGGLLYIDRAKMFHAVNEGSLEMLFRPDSDVTKGFLRKLTDISINPLDYVDKTIVVYPNTRNRFAYNPYITSIYSGIMYNNYC